MPSFDEVSIIGLGLIGGSLGLAIRRKRLARRVIGCSRSEAALRAARRIGAIDAGSTDPRSAVRSSRLVILATPVNVIVPMARRIAAALPRGAVITDVGSTKAEIVSALGRGPSRGVSFVGAHPIAGSERRGIDAARADLFEGSLCILTPTAKTDVSALRQASALWKSVCGRVTEMDPRRHDRLLAEMSHLPHAVAACLARAPRDASEVSARSFLDATRIAKSDPDLWDDIFLSNRAGLLDAMERFETEWRRMKAIIRSDSPAALRRFLAAAKKKRDALEP